MDIRLCRVVGLMGCCFNPPAADEGLIPRPLGRLKFSI